MKINALAATTAATLAAIAAAQSRAYEWIPLHTSSSSTLPTSNDFFKQFNQQNTDATSTKYHHGMPQFSNPFSRTSTALDYQYSHYRKISPYERSVGVAVTLGRIIPKKERQTRMDFVIGSTMDGQIESQLDSHTVHNWSAFKDIAASDPRVQALRSWYQSCCHSCSRCWSWVLDTPDWDKDVDFRLAATLVDFWSSKRRHNLRSLICFVIIFLLVFGGLYVLLEYLLLTTRASACSVSTLYIPVTYTVTAGQPVVSAQAASNDSTPLVTRTSTTTHTSTVMETLTSFLTIPSNSSSIVTPSSTGSPGYAYTTDSAGSTEWINGVSPSSGASIVVVTTTIVMQPLPPSDPRVSAQSTAQTTDTITLPAQTSTTYALQDTDSTSTSISTHYITYTLSEVHRSSTRTITTTRSSFDGVSTSGWNASDPTDPATSDPLSTLTMTTIGYFGAGPDITSTTTMFITSTIALQYTTTVYPSTGIPYVTTITALPVTISEGGSPSSTTLQAPNTSSATSSPTSAFAPNSSSVASAASTDLATSAPPGYASGTITSSSVQSNTSSFAVSAASVSASQPSGMLPSYGISGNYSSIGASKSFSSSASSSVTAGAITATFTSLTSAVSPDSSTRATNTTVVSGTVSSGSTSSITNGTTRITSTASGPQTSNSSTAGPFSSSRSPAASNTSAIGPASASQSSRNTTISLTLPGYSTHASSSSASSSFPSLSIVNTFTSKTTRAKGTPVAGSSSGFTSANATLSTTRAKGSPLSGTNTSKTTHAKGKPLTGSSPSASPQSGMTTSVRPSSANQSSSNSGISAASISTTASSVSSVKITVTPPTPVSITVTPRSSTSVIVSSVSSGSSPISTKVSTTTSFSNPFPPSSATATPTAGCGEQGNILLTFDDLPNFLPTGANDTSISQAPPIFSPYNHLTFSDGYVYAPEPSEPYQPISPPHLAVFLPNGTGKVSSQSGNFIKPGEIGDGPYEAISAFWFDGLSAFFGCDNAGPGVCTLIFKAYTWDSVENAETLSHQHSAVIPPCTTMQDLNCQLQQVTFPTSFQNLTGLQIQASTDEGQRMFYMDNLDLRWSNSSCAAGMLRQWSQ